MVYVQTLHASKLSEASTSCDPSVYQSAKQLRGMCAKNRRFHIPGMEEISPLEDADSINAHFISTVSSLPPQDRAQLPAFLPARYPAPIVTRGDIWRELSYIKVRLAAGPDHITSKLLKIFAFELSVPMTDIMNSSLASSYVSPQWKATVGPVLKMTPTPSMDKHCPNCLTCTLSKVCESFVMR